MPPESGQTRHCSVICHQENQARSVSQAMTEENMPAELFPQCSTMEYTPRSTVQSSSPAYIFVVDTCLSEDELGACRTALSQALLTIPEYALVRCTAQSASAHS